jgi:site-specific recombinase XerD
MKQTALLGSYLRRFLLEDLVADRNLSSNSQKSYRDTFILLVQFMEARHGVRPDRLAVEHVSANVVREFLVHLQKERGNSDSTRNQRLAALRSLFRFIGRSAPELVELATAVLGVPMRKTTSRPVPYLEKAEMDAILATPDRNTPQGHRDYALLLFLYNTGARADEAAGLVRRRLELGTSSFVEIHGKGSKIRHCPLWPATAKVLAAVLDRDIATGANDPVFVNRYGDGMTRFGLYSLVKRAAMEAAKVAPAIALKRVSPHTIRHTTAVHLLRAGVDPNTIRAWLGHVSLETTNKYAEVDLEMKAAALKATEIPVGSVGTYRGRSGATLLSFLQSIGRESSALCGQPD